MHKGLIQTGSGKPQVDVRVQTDICKSVSCSHPWEAEEERVPAGGRAMLPRGPLGEWMQAPARPVMHSQTQEAGSGGLSGEAPMSGTRWGSYCMQNATYFFRLPLK